MTNQKQQYRQISDTVDTKPPRDILSLVLSFIGLGRSNTQDDDSNRSVYSFSFSSTSTKVASTSSSSSSSTSAAETTESSSTHYTCDDVDQSTLYSAEGTMLTSSSPSPSSSSLPSSLLTTSSVSVNKMIEESTVFVPSATSERQSLYETWAFQEWLQRLPKLALFHLISTTAMQDPMIAYHLLEYQYMDDINNNNKTTITSTTTTATSDTNNSNPCDNTTRTLVKEMAWIQTHSRAIIHQLDHLRPNEQFAKAKEISDQLFSMVRLCGQQFHGEWNDSWITIMALILVAHECLDNDVPPEIRQHLFYRAKFGRPIVLEMNAVLKNLKIYHRGNAQCQSKKERYTSSKMSPQQYVANFFFSQHQQQQESMTPLVGNALASVSSSSSSGWHVALETVCNKLARLDDGWNYRDEYQQVVTLATNILSE